jgi:hypothetical protein
MIFLVFLNAKPLFELIVFFNLLASEQPLISLIIDISVLTLPAFSEFNLIIMSSHTNIGLRCWCILVLLGLLFCALEITFLIRLHY